MSRRRAGAGGTSSLDWAASLTISAFWHLLVLAVLALAVHPFQLPDVERPMDVELLPPLVTPPLPTLDLQLRPREPEPETQRLKPAPLRPPEIEPPLRPAQPEPPPPEPVTVTRPSPSVVNKPVELDRRPVQAPRLQTDQARPQIPEAPPEPVATARPAPILQRPSEVSRTAPAPQIDSSRPLAAPQIQAPQAEAAPETAPSQVQVLTNRAVVQAPVEIRPREQAPAAPRTGSLGAAPDIPAEGGGQPAGGAAGAPATGGGQVGGLRPFAPLPGGATGGINGGFGQKGLRTTVGCENPDAYRLTPEERAACLQRFGQRAQGAPALDNIPAGKRADYDRAAACQAARSSKEVPHSTGASAATSIAGLGANPSLRECPPGR